jgi:hypothetical protein
MSKTKSRWGNPVYSEADIDIRQILGNESLPVGMKAALLAEQLEKLHKIKDEADPDWRERQIVRCDPVEVQVVRQGSCDGMRRVQHYE